MRHLFICTLLCILPIPGLAQDWKDRLTASDPKVRASAATALVRGAAGSLPALRRLLAVDDEDLQLKTFDIIRRMGPTAMPLLVDLLRDERVAIRRNAVDALIDLAPYTESIQPALRRALRDDDSDVAGDAARALGALGKRATPSVRRPGQDSLAREPIRPRLRGRGPVVDRSECGRGDRGPRQGPGRFESRRSMGGVRSPRHHRPRRAIRRAAADRSADG